MRAIVEFHEEHGARVMAEHRLRSPAAIISILLCGFGQAFAADPTGLWKTQDGDAHIRIASCGSQLCGTVEWLREPTDAETGKPVLDKNNPDPARRARPVIGLPIAIGFRPAEGDKWSGKFYNSDDGHTYSGSLTRSSPNTLSVEGCLLVFCQTQLWTRVGS